LFHWPLATALVMIGVHAALAMLGSAWATLRGRREVADG
jgi:hypothetical protein